MLDSYRLINKVRTSRTWVMGNRLASFTIIRLVHFFHRCMTIVWDSYVVCIVSTANFHKPLWLFNHPTKILNIVTANEEECWQEICNHTSYVFEVSTQSVCFVIYEVIPYCEVHMCLGWLLKVPIFECHV